MAKYEQWRGASYAPRKYDGAVERYLQKTETTTNMVRLTWQELLAQGYSEVAPGIYRQEPVSD